MAIADSNRSSSGIRRVMRRRTAERTVSSDVSMNATNRSKAIQRGGGGSVLVEVAVILGQLTRKNFSE